MTSITECWALRYKADDKHYALKPMKIDMTSGGYPYPVEEWHLATMFPTKEKASAYLHHFADFLEPVKLNITTEVIADDIQ